MWLVTRATVLAPEDLLSAEVVRPSQPLFQLLPLHGVLFCMTIDILLTLYLGGYGGWGGLLCEKYTITYLLATRVIYVFNLPLYKDPG